MTLPVLVQIIKKQNISLNIKDRLLSNHIVKDQGWIDNGMHSVQGVKMEKIDSDSLANIHFRMQYEDDSARHTSLYYARRVNLWRDVLPGEVYEGLISKSAGESFSLDLGPGTVVDDYRNSNRRFIKPQQFRRVTPAGFSVQPHYGRYYPKGLLLNVSGIYPENIEPFRCLDVNAGGIEVEFNHPLAGKPVKLSVVVDQVIRKVAEHGGSCIDWMEVIANGPGMQSRSNGKPTDFFSNGAFIRKNEKGDSEFYRNPRFVNHVDRQALKSIQQLYTDLIPPGSNVLDVMSSWNSHLPPGLALNSVTGLGLNRAELEANESLTRHVVQDINRNPVLPFESGEFDAAICSLSVEYLTQPRAVFAEIARVLKDRGVFVVTFSNRWFPPKVVDIWTELHEFERLGLVLEYFASSESFAELETLAVRGYPRPIDDKYFPQLRYADSVYGVWGRKIRED